MALGKLPKEFCHLVNVGGVVGGVMGFIADGEQPSLSSVKYSDSNCSVEGNRGPLATLLTSGLGG